MTPAATLADQLAAFIAAQTGGRPSVTIEGLRRITGGLSRETWSFDAVVDGGAPQPCILMRSAPAGVLDTDRAREFALLRSLHGTAVPVPEVLWLDADGSWLERPAFVMQRVPGVTDRSPLGRIRTGAAERVDDDFLTALVALHRLDVDSVDLPGVPMPTVDTAAHQQIARWEAALSADDLARQPGVVEVITWLREHAPVAPRISVVHGDYRYGNFLWEGDRITAVLDWEEAHFGDPVEDVPWSFRPFRRGTEPLLPFPEWVAAYERASAITVDPRAVAWYRILGELKSVAIYLTGLRSLRVAGDRDLALAIPGQLIPCTIRQALLWIDELELAGVQ